MLGLPVQNKVKWLRDERAGTHKSVFHSFDLKRHVTIRLCMPMKINQLVNRVETGKQVQENVPSSLLDCYSLDKHVNPGSFHRSADAFPRGHHGVFLFGSERQPAVSWGWSTVVQTRDIVTFGAPVTTG